MASSHSSDQDECYWKIPLAKLNSAVISERTEAKEEIHQLLLSDSRDNNAVLGDLFNLYVSTNCSAASEILLDQSQQNHVNFLFEKMNDSLKTSDRKYPTLMLLWSIIQRQPSWLHTIISTAFFNSFIKCLKADNDVVTLMSGVLIITSLLPSIPSLVGSFLVDFFEIFERVFLFTARKRGFIPDTHLLHLRVGVHLFFHRLYAMYPNNTLAFMKSFYESHHDKEVTRSIEFLLRWVKFHPWLITETEQTEISNSRWRSKEPHDVIIDCEKISLDPKDCHLQESEVLSLVYPSRQSFSEANTLESSGILTSSDNSVQQTAHDEDRLDTGTQTGTSLQNQSCPTQTEGSIDSGTDMQNNSTPLVASNVMLCSPTTLCSLTTPPRSQDTSPTGSILDVSLGHTYSQPSPLLSSNNISNLEMSDITRTPTIPEHRRRPSAVTLNETQQTGEDAPYCGRFTPPINIKITKNDEKQREPCLNLNLDVEDTTNDKENTVRSTGSSEKDSKCKPKFPADTLEMLLQCTTICRHCLEDRSGNLNRVKSDWESQLSPVQLLDQYLKFGKSLQERRLNRIPLTSQGGTQWTHFGGCPPADEIVLLRSELLLLQSEVLFERHKCDLHATRNRRLVGKVFQTNAVKEELLAVKDQMKLLEMNMVSLEKTLSEKITENRTLKEELGSSYSQLKDEIRELAMKNEGLSVQKKDLDEDVRRFRSENDNLQAELKESKARISQLENDMSHLKSLENENGLLKSQADTQAKNLVIMGEREEQLQDLIHILRTKVNKSPEDEVRLKIYQKELEAARVLVNEQKAELTYYRSHVSEIEGGLAQKEHQMKDLKKSVENIKKFWTDKLEGVESKYQTIKRANQRLESEVMSLHSKLDARTRDR